MTDATILTIMREITVLIFSNDIKADVLLVFSALFLILHNEMHLLSIIILQIVQIPSHLSQKVLWNINYAIIVSTDPKKKTS